jgi:hypothetical protein
MRGGLIDDACQCAKLLGAGGYSRVVQRIGHLSFSFGGILWERPWPPAVISRKDSTLETAADCCTRDFGPVYVRFGRQTDLTVEEVGDVRFTPESGHREPYLAMSALCQKRTYAAQQKAPLFDHLISNSV